MGPALNTASSMGAYILADRGTWLSLKNRGDLAILVEGDQKLFNQYGIMLVNPAKHPSTKVDLGNAFINWVVSPAGQKAIAYKVFRCWVSEYQALPYLDANANAVAIQIIKLENEGWERYFDVT